MERTNENLSAEADQRQSAAKKGRRGGRRPGAGAPRGNLNALKTGLYSKQFASFGALVAADPRLRRNLLALGEKHDIKRRRASQIAALLLTKFVENERRRAGGRLNIDFPVDEWDSIKETASQLSGGKYGKYGDDGEDGEIKKYSPESIEELVQMAKMIKNHRSNRIRNRPEDQLIDPLGWID